MSDIYYQVEGTLRPEDPLNKVEGGHVLAFPEQLVFKPLNNFTDENPDNVNFAC